MQRKLIAVGVLLALLVTAAMAQRLDGTLRGTVTDQSGAVVPNATVTVTNTSTGVQNTSKTSSAGTYVFPSMPVGTYNLTVESANFKKHTRTQLEVRSNQVTEAHAKLEVGATTETVEVVAGAELVQSESSQLTNTYKYLDIQRLPGGSNPLNLAIFLPNTTAAVGGTAGSGGSVGGTRPRMNSFTIDGVDDNDVSVTGPMSTVVQDAVEEFALTGNQFSAEYGHSAGGQFALVSRSGTNDWHGNGFWFTQNRKLNALDNVDKAGGVTRECPREGSATCSPQPRFDRNIVGGTVGGPIIRNKVFVFGAFQKIFQGEAGSPSGITVAPTAAGLANLQTLAVNSSVSDILDQFPVAGAATGTVMVNRRDNAGNIVQTLPVEVGNFVGFIPDFLDEYDWHANGDVNLGRHAFRGRYLYNHFRSPLTPDGAPQAQFTGALAYDVRKLLFKDTWSITDRLISDLTLAWTKQDGSNLTVPAAFSNFPNVEVKQLSNFVMGPLSVAPQGGFMNSYQASENISYLSGAHSWKVGVEYRKWIGTSGFLPRARGEWIYETLDELVSDFVPTNFAKRGAGSGDFEGNQQAIYWFVQDDYKVTPRLTLNLGLRYEYVSNPKGSRTQLLNKVSDLAGTVFIFDVPETDRNNFAPRAGFAWDPTGSGKWSIRGGFGVAYDVTFQNLPLLQLPPQLQSEQDAFITCGLPAAPAWCANFAGGAGPGQGFLAGGGLLQVNVPPATQQEARNSTQGVMLDIIQPRVTTWSFGVQRELGARSVLELRYLGTDSRNLPIQVQANSRTAFANGAQALPMFFSVAEIPADFTGAPTVADFLAARARPFASLNAPNDGFLGSVTTFPQIGKGHYHGGALTYRMRTWHGVSAQSNYTFSKNVDNSTNELFTSQVNPRRPEDKDNMDNENARSVLDVTHKFAVGLSYEFPKVSNALRGLVNGWVIGGTYLWQSGQPVTVLSFRDLNGNFDSAGDRAVVNPNGSPLTGTDSGFVCFAAGVVSTSATGCAGGDAETVGYFALNPSAGFVRGRPGVRSTNGRNNIPSEGLNNLDLQITKNTHITERVYVQFRAELFNALNHRQFSYARPTIFSDTDQASFVTSFVNPGSADFRNAKSLNGGNREIQLGMKVFF